MATSITADDMLAALKKWGIVPNFYKADWRTHNRNAVQGWGPLYGFVVHNFASDISDTSSLAYLYNGDSARQLPGPLSQFAITDDGKVWIIGWGTANHCKSVDKDLHALVLKDAAPLDRDFVPNSSTAANGGTDSNPHYIGVEMTYGAKGATAAQRASCVRLAAAMVDMLGGIADHYTGGSVIGHREATTTRSDPTGVPMWQFRRDVNALLKAGPKPAITTPQEDDMPTVNEIWGADIIPAPNPDDTTNPTWTPASYLTWQYREVLALKTQVKAIADKVGAPIDVDEAAIASGVLEGLVPVVRQAVEQAVDSGVPAEKLADAVVSALGQRLNPA